MENKSKWKHIDVLKFDVHGRNGRVLIKAGSRGVDFVPHGGCFMYEKPDGTYARVNKYRDSLGRIVYGH